MKKTLKKMMLLIVVSLWISSCSTIPTNAVLKLPPEINYPSISPEEVSCLTDNVFNKLKKRDKLKAARIDTLKSIIRATWE